MRHIFRDYGHRNLPSLYLYKNALPGLPWIHSGSRDTGITYRLEYLLIRGKQFVAAYFTFDASAERPVLNGGPLIGQYIFEQMHFHWSVDEYTGCEHVLDGRGYAAECHFVHYNSKYQSMEAAMGYPDGLAVVGFFLEEVDAPNPKFDSLVHGLEGISKRENSVVLTAESLSWMNSSNLHEGSYVTYKGSLTTPPYTECVTWIIYEKPVQIGSQQLSLMRKLEGPNSLPIERNVRPTQRQPPGHSVIYVKQVEQSKL
ncbi:carbonic anhydrase 2 isoform X4 [Galleria mellonella]|uniref:Carbonic anhydrase 2 isoform X4 n=1 Tax=Galleria mellonella TaxID=7137 RepID=A0ABM3MY02_GALME|nr:carbonic anhydrase 2 isoform X4 [Galleria mellonella]